MPSACFSNDPTVEESAADGRYYLRVDPSLYDQRNVKLSRICPVNLPDRARISKLTIYASPGIRDRGSLNLDDFTEIEDQDHSVYVVKMANWQDSKIDNKNRLYFVSIQPWLGKPKLIKSFRLYSIQIEYTLE